ncbi:PREDICTED: uncharacterized protein LOC104768579 [Camelina sativa]|uniref:Uncharacterized protein LOC104768579 n=1 Tax=Camelina sativa TaxID=90675 RepID=A0ABM0XTM9_CAMSA|nr:PREDICTED: uncharacterized protein LOC104768579 [Camelina sativa]
MGNCIVMEKKVIKIVRNDGKVLEYREPVSVGHILTQFSGHTLSHNNTYLLPDAKLLSGRLYYLLPTMIKKKVNKKVTFANPEVEEEDDERRSLRDDDDDTSESNNNIDGDENKSVVRMKIIVHKQELEKLLQGGSVHEMMYQTLEKQLLLTSSDDDDLDCNRSWKPLLDSIPESESLRRT